MGCLQLLPSSSFWLVNSSYEIKWVQIRYFHKSLKHVALLLHSRLRDKRHQDFVRGVCWAPGGSDTLTTVGWDHQVLHHITGQDGPAINAVFSARL